MEQQIKKPIYKRWWFWVVSPLVLLIIIGIFSGNDDKTTTQAPQTDQRSDTLQAQKQYQPIFTFGGNGAKKSESFTITGDRFKIAYDCKGDPIATLCTAFVYKVGSSFPQAIMNSPQSVKDETIIYTNMAGRGEYYIDANVLGNFTMTIYDYK